MHRILTTIVAFATINQINLQRQALPPVTNSAVFATHVQIHGPENTCQSTNKTVQYTCTFINATNGGETLTAYVPGMIFLLWPDTTCTASCSVDIDNQGIKTITLSDGTTEPGGAILAGHGYLVFFDGNVVRMVG